jgi:acetyl esterase/lipase
MDMFKAISINILALCLMIPCPTLAAETPKWGNVVYANKSSAQAMDIYVPSSGSGPFPLIIAIHGGAFMLGDKTGETASTVSAGLARGYAVASINYRLSGEAKFPAQINDVKAAIRLLRANSTTYNIDPNRFATWGGSAGGNLAALAAVSFGVTELTDLSLGNPEISDRVQAAIDQFGPIYFSTMDAEFAALGQTPKMGATNSSNSPETKYLGQTIGTAAAEPLVIAASPQTYITADDPPFYVQHGTADRNIPITQSVNFSNELIAVLGAANVTYEVIAGAGHGTSEFSSAANLGKLLDFLDKTLSSTLPVVSQCTTFTSPVVNVPCVNVSGTVYQAKMNLISTSPTMRFEVDMSSLQPNNLIPTEQCAVFPAPNTIDYLRINCLDLGDKHWASLQLVSTPNVIQFDLVDFAKTNP